MTLKLTLFDGSYHDVDSLKWHLKLLVLWHLKKLLQKCNPVILEPIMKVEVVVPEEYMGDVMGDINSRRGRIEGMEARGNAQVVRCNGSTF